MALRSSSSLYSNWQTLSAVLRSWKNRRCICIRRDVADRQSPARSHQTRHPIFLTTHSLDMIDHLLAAFHGPEIDQISVFHVILKEGQLISSHLAALKRVWRALKLRMTFDDWERDLHPL